MNSNIYSTKIEKWTKNKSLFEIITDAEKVETEIDNIYNPNGNVNIEIIQFISPFPFYKKIEQKRKEFAKKLKNTNDVELRKITINELNSIEEEQKLFLKNTIYLAHQFTQIPLENDLEIVAKLFFEGNISHASKLLNEDELIEKHIKYLKENEKLNQAYSQVEENANEFKIKAQITIINLDIEDSENRFQKAINLYEKGIISAKYTRREDFYVSYIVDYAMFLSKQSQFNKAETLYEEALDIFNDFANKEPNNYLPRIATILNNLAFLLRTKNDFSQALEKYNKALEIRRMFANSNPDKYLGALATTLNHMGILHKEVNDFQLAMKEYNEALELRRVLASKNPNKYLNVLAMTLNNISILYWSNHEYLPALSKIKEVYKIRKELAKKSPKDFLPDLAMTLHNFAVIYSAKNELKLALKKFKEAIKIRRQLVDSNPRAYLPDLAMSLNNVANLYSINNDISNSFAYYNEALHSYIELADTNPSVFLPNVAMVLNNLSVLHSNNDEFSQALKKNEEALKIYRDFAKVNPDVYLPDVAMTLNNLAVLYLDLNDISRANNRYEESLSIKKNLVCKNPEKFEIGYAKSLAMGVFLFNKEDSILTRVKGILMKYPEITYTQEILDRIIEYENNCRVGKGESHP